MPDPVSETGCKIVVLNIVQIVIKCRPSHLQPFQLYDTTCSFHQLIVCLKRTLKST